MIRVALAGLLLVATFAVGYPLACVAEHGTDLRLWPGVAEIPAVFLWRGFTSYGLHFVETYQGMFHGQAPALAGGGFAQALGIALVGGVAAGWVGTPKLKGPERDPRGTYGDARWTSVAERARMRAGLEVGTDPVTGRTVRFAVKGNLVSIAPPRTGKTSGLLIPNLLAPEASAWFGPVVVIDPKGEAYAATARRRRALGRRVVCLDPVDIVGGVDTWNPLLTIDPDDILYLQRLARALLPSSVSAEGQYFHDRAADVIVAGFLAARAEGEATARRVSQYLADLTLFAKVLKTMPADPSRKVAVLLDADAKTRDPILSTAAQAFQWCDDPRLQRLTATSTLDLRAVCRGEADLFITLPTEDMRGLAPLIRWLLTELFTSVRRHRPTERLVVFIDEARVLGRFDEIVLASGELPGYNASLWTFWQDRSQLLGLYGEADARTMLATAEVVTLSDPALVDPNEREHWSRAIGDYTLLEESRTIEAAQDGKPGRTTISKTAKAARLKTAQALSELPSTDLLVLPNSPAHPKRALQIRKTRHNDPRLDGLADAIAGTAAA
ncbi:type IV secretory system conjugative DNA transfer family protein [Methylobacterium radiotolerans]|uniref:type IV secretory system conjugative DNA transfer family protein n=1 Tax=Methylobacterium radiotolerans TaxID=31998 RepID=UPI001F1AD15B|nr:type IV secretory system conjugative DNA transfer family protein [Methylobacterium radiotolerans]UIY43504.1 type IV secretory system conjugative DNA transfer family protein [Methylobacterium radiotolerans]